MRAMSVCSTIPPMAVHEDVQKGATQKESRGSRPPPTAGIAFWGHERLHLEVGDDHHMRKNERRVSEEARGKGGDGGRARALR